MPNIPDSFLEAWVIPNNIRLTKIDTTYTYIHDNIPDYPITFTESSSGHIWTMVDYTLLEDIASDFLKKNYSGVKIVIDVTGRDIEWRLIWHFHIYQPIINFWNLTWLHKGASLEIAKYMRTAKQIKPKGMAEEVWKEFHNKLSDYL